MRFWSIEYARALVRSGVRSKAVGLRAVIQVRYRALLVTSVSPSAFLAGGYGIEK